MFKPRRARRIRGLSFNRIVPNIMTMAALCAGLTAVRYALDGRWRSAVVAILVAAVLDALDGRVARLLSGSTKFGAELDSLADFISFGVAPALVLYLWTMRAAGDIGWALVLLYAVCCALRLARFNTMQPETGQAMPPSSFFVGVPAPAAAAIVMVPMAISFQQNLPRFFNEPAVCGVVLVSVSLLMVSRIPTYSFKRLRVPHRLVLPILLLAGVFLVSLVTVFWATLTVLGMLYLISIPFSTRAERRFKARIAAEQVMAADVESTDQETIIK